MDYEKRKRSLVNVAFGGMILLAVYLAIKYVFGLMTPFLLAFIFAYVLHRPAVWIAGKAGVAYKPMALILVLLFYCVIVLLAALLGANLVSNTIKLVSALPEFYTTKIVPALSSLFNRMEQALSGLDPVILEGLNTLGDRYVETLGQMVSSISMELVSLLSGLASSLPALFVKIVLMIISTFFIAGDYDHLMGFAARQLPAKAKALIRQINAYVVGTLLVCIRSYLLIMSITFVELAVGLTVLRIPYSVLIALLISVFDILPVLGTGGIMIPWVVIDVILGNYSLALGLLVLYLIITVIRNIIEPKIVGKQIGLHPVITLASMFVGVQLLGVWGLFGFPIGLSLLRHLNDTGTVKIFR